MSQNVGRDRFMEIGDQNGSGNPPQTRWSVVIRAVQTDTGVRLKALDELIETYLPVLRRHLVVNMHFSVDQVDDLIQNFIADEIVEKSILGLADKAKGRFRNFLLKTFSNYAIGEIRRAGRKKRGPTDSRVVNLDEHPDAVADSPRLENAFDIAWARQILAETLKRMRIECEEK